MITKVFMLPSAYQEVMTSHYDLRNAIIDEVMNRLVEHRSATVVLVDCLNELRSMPIVPYVDGETGDKNYG